VWCVCVWWGVFVGVWSALPVARASLFWSVLEREVELEFEFWEEKR